MNRMNFEKTKRSTVETTSEETRSRLKKLGKTQRGGGVKGKFRESKDSIINQERYFAGA